MLEYSVFLLAYLLGTIPFAYLAGKYKGIDISKEGSGNLGATNAFRLLGKKIGILVLAGDSLKGMIAAFLGVTFFGPWGGIVGGLLAMAGHSWNPYFGFRPSGKGVACGLGTIIILMPTIMLIAIAVFVITVAITRYVSLGSILGALSVLLMSFVFSEPLAYKLFSLVGVSLIVIRHRANILRLLNGTEARLGQKI